VPAPGNLAAGDLNGDGYPDLVVTSGKEQSITILVNDGRGRFNSASNSPLRLRFNPGEIALGDVNGDGNLDLGVATHDSYVISLFAGDGKGGFKPTPDSPVSTRQGRRPHTHDLVFRDLNEDRKLDVLTVNSDDGTVSVLLGDGAGNFAPADSSPFAVGRSPYPLAIGDIDGDGKLDLLVPNVEDGDVSIMLGDGRGHFVPSGFSPLKAGTRGYFIAPGDLNNDSRLDFVVSHDDSTEVSVWLNKGGQGFQAAPISPLELNNRAFQVAVVDMNKDSKLDLVLASNTSVTVMLGDGRANFSAASGSPFPAGKGTWRLAVADLNNDAKRDVVCSNLESDTVTILIAGR